MRRRPDHLPTAPFRARLQAFRGSDTGEAGALAGAMLANNAIQLIFTLAVTRILGTDDYGALAALISAFLILVVGGQALQAAAAREVALGRFGPHAELAAALRGWTRTLLLVTLAAVAAGAVLGGSIADAVSVPEERWGAAAVPVVGALWLLLSLQRGVLQGLHELRPVGVSIVAEAGLRLPLGLGLAAVAGPGGAFVASGLCFAILAVALGRVLERRLGAPVWPAPRGRAAAADGLRTLLGHGWQAILGLLVFAVLQNVDVILARHRLDDDRAGAYAVALVAAKAITWVAAGVALQLLPRAAALAAAGRDPRGMLWRAIAVLGVVAAPALVIFAAVPRPLLRIAFGDDALDAAPALLLLGVAMTLVAVTYLAIQFMIAVGSVRFLPVITAVIAVEIAVLGVADLSIVAFAAVVTAVQLAAAAGVLALALRAWRPVAP